MLEHARTVFRNHFTRQVTQDFMMKLQSQANSDLLLKLTI